MDQATQQNAALVEEAAAAAESMQQQARALAQAVSVFKLDAAHAIATQSIAAVAAAPVVERREPNRAKNGTRLPAKAANSSVSAIGAKSGIDDEWTSSRKSM